MYGSGKYSLDSVKEIRVTDGFKTLKENQKKCQTAQTYEQCLTNLLQLKMKEACNCIPYELANFSLTHEVC